MRPPPIYHPFFFSSVVFFTGHGSFFTVLGGGRGFLYLEEVVGERWDFKVAPPPPQFIIPFFSSLVFSLARKLGIQVSRGGGFLYLGEVGKHRPDWILRCASPNLSSLFSHLWFFHWDGS